MVTRSKIFDNLFERWQAKNFALDFYFDKIFDQVLDSLHENTNHKLVQEIANGRYKALFAPVGYSIENIAIIVAFVRPEFLMMAFSELTHRFHRKNLNMLKENIKKFCRNIIIDDITIKGDDQKKAEEKIIEWIEEMKDDNGLTNEQLAIDLTGGTKPMSIGAQNAALSFQTIDALYLYAEYDETGQRPLLGSEKLIRLIKGKSQVDRNLVFIIMPFTDTFNKIYNWIEQIVTNSGLRCIRVDKEIFIGGIMDRIKEDILKAGIIIAELSEKNLNVYYELGLAHANNKNVIMLTQNIDELPFDLRHLRMVIYKPNDKASFQQKLAKEISYCKQLIT